MSTMKYGQPDERNVGEEEGTRFAKIAGA